MRTILKGLLIIPLLLLYAFVSAIIFLFPVDRKTKRVIAIQAVSSFARILLVLLGVRVYVKHRECLHKTGDGRLVVSNHISYLDVLVISSLVPSVFVTSVELKNTAFLGMLARLSGSIFVERRKASGLKQEIGQIGLVLTQGMHVALFPEGTTSNGDRVQPFKNSLFDAVVLTRADIMPVCIRYTRVNGVPLIELNRDDVFYYGGATFLKHFTKLLALKSVDVEVVLLAPIKVQEHDSRKDLAAEAHSIISAAYKG